MAPTGRSNPAVCECCSVGFVSPVSVGTFGHDAVHALCDDCETAAEAVLHAAVDLVLIRCNAMVEGRAA